ncbi:MAG: hypothetical protein DMG61_13560 [Acidobacteria bacterium]|nr:MAG: hypothetical protein DMG61_13560 [Acidobacteriota bacterium]
MPFFVPTEIQNAVTQLFALAITIVCAFTENGDSAKIRAPIDAYAQSANVFNWCVIIPPLQGALNTSTASKHFNAEG